MKQFIFAVVLALAVSALGGLPSASSGKDGWGWVWAPIPDSTVTPGTDPTTTSPSTDVTTMRPGTSNPSICFANGGNQGQCDADIINLIERLLIGMPMPDTLKHLDVKQAKNLPAVIKRLTKYLHCLLSELFGNGRYPLP